MQVQFGDHPYLFVNPQFEGKYISPAEAAKTNSWINYGGDKLWPMPEGPADGEHWPGPISDALDDGDYSFQAKQGSTCSLHLQGAADAATGLQYSRDVRIDGTSPEISFHAEMKNASDHEIRWSMQSVTQYDTADSKNPARYDHDFWAFAPVNRHSAFVDCYHVRSGLADDPSFVVEHGLFTLHWLYLENEVWLDSDAGWIAIVDDAAQFGMIEEFHYQKEAEYPGGASVIFYKNGAALALDDAGMPKLRSADPQHAPYYMEAELNSPMVRLAPGASSEFETTWYPVRAKKNFQSVGASAIVQTHLATVVSGEKVHLAGEFAVFFPGHLAAQIFGDKGLEREVDLGAADPLRLVKLDTEIAVSSTANRVVLHLQNEQGVDQGVVDESPIVRPGRTS